MNEFNVVELKWVLCSKTMPSYGGGVIATEGAFPILELLKLKEVRACPV